MTNDPKGFGCFGRSTCKDPGELLSGKASLMGLGRKGTLGRRQHVEKTEGKDMSGDNMGEGRGHGS